jgi:capsular exopolysaccharide synthesis family protein
MSNIREALKKAQEERDRARGAAPAATRNPAAGSLSSPQEPFRPGRGRTETPEPQIAGNPLTQAVAQARETLSPAQQAVSRRAEAICEDYESKRKMQLPQAMVVYYDRSGAAAEQYRQIRSALLADHPGPQMLTITSSRPKEGKTTSLRNLGLSAVELRSLRVLLIDGDMHRGTLSSLLKVQEHRGLAELAQSGDAPESYVQPTPWRQLFVLPAGGLQSPGAAAETLQASALRNALRRLRGMYDLVLIDAPPAGKCPDAGLLGACGDGVLMVVSLKKTRRSEAERSLRMLTSLNIPLRGAILTKAAPEH